MYFYQENFCSFFHCFFESINLTRDIILIIYYSHTYSYWNNFVIFIIFYINMNLNIKTRSDIFKNITFSVSVLSVLSSICSWILLFSDSWRITTSGTQFYVENKRAQTNACVRTAILLCTNAACNAARSNSVKEGEEWTGNWVNKGVTSYFLVIHKNVP